MSLWHCTGCSAAYAVGLPACPQCGATDHLEDPLPPYAYACPTDGCGGRWALKLLACPRCGATDLREESLVPRITVHGGAIIPGEAAQHDPEPAPAAPAEPDSSGGAHEPQEAPETPDAGGPGAEDAGPVRPASSASKPAWVEYVVARGLDQAAAQAMKKTDLQAWEPPPDGEQIGVTGVAEAEVVHADGSRS